MLSFPSGHIVFLQNVCGSDQLELCIFAKACLHFWGENTETFSSLTSYPELRRSEFLIGGYVGARALPCRSLLPAL